MLTLIVCIASSRAISCRHGTMSTLVESGTWIRGTPLEICSPQDMGIERTCSLEEVDYLNNPCLSAAQTGVKTSTLSVPRRGTYMKDMKPYEHIVLWEQIHTYHSRLSPPFSSAPYLSTSCKTDEDVRPVTATMSSEYIRNVF